jgi:hypothetical protein
VVQGVRALDLETPCTRQGTDDVLGRHAPGAGRASPLRSSPRGLAHEG